MQQSFPFMRADRSFVARDVVVVARTDARDDDDRSRLVHWQASHSGSSIAQNFGAIGSSVGAGAALRVVDAVP